MSVVTNEEAVAQAKNLLEVVSVPCAMCGVDFETERANFGPWLMLDGECEAALEDAAERMAR